MVHVIWEFHVKQDSITEFERHYSAQGTWAELFRKDPAYQGTILLRDPERPGRYLTTDIWLDYSTYLSFQERNRQSYTELEQKFSALTGHESCLGHFEVAV